MYDTVIFDMDGTILDTLLDLRESVNYALNEIGYASITAENVKKAVGNGIYTLAQRVLPYGVSQKEILKWIEIFKNHYSKNMYNHTKPYDGIIDVLKVLKERKIKTAIVSNKYDNAVKELSKKYFDGLFDIAIGQSEIIEPKPSAKGILEVIKILNGKNVIYSGDSDVDIQTAQNANIPVIAVTWGFQDRENLCGADYIINTPDEYLNILLRN